MSTIAQLLIEQAREAAAARSASGALWGNAISSVSQIPGQVLGAQQAKQARDQAHALAVARDAREASTATDEHQLRVATLESMRQKQAADWAEKLRVANADVPTVQGEIDAQVGKLWTPDEATALKTAASTPEGAARIITRLAPVREAKPAEPFTLGEDQVRFGPDGKELARGPAKAAPAVTEAMLDARQQMLLAKQARGVALTPDESADVKAYQDRKRTVSDPAMIAATERQTTAATNQAAQQRRAQDFESLKTARADIQKNADTPFQTAKSSAATLRDVVTAAQAGNKVAGSLQSLETTMAAIRAQGLNRINRTETDMTGNAGSMYDRISGWLGKAAEGQPVPPAIQKDMLAFSDILENAAAKKYLATHNGINKLYGTSIPPTFDISPSPPPPATGATGPTYQDYLNSRKKP